MLKKAIALVSVAILVVMAAIIVVVLNNGDKTVNASGTGNGNGVTVTPPPVTEPTIGEYLLVVQSRTQDGARELINETMPREEAIIAGNSQITLDRAAFDMYYARKLVRVTVDGVNVTWANGEYTYIVENNTEIIAYYEISYVTLTLKCVTTNGNPIPWDKETVKMSVAYNAIEQLYLANTEITGLASDDIGFDQYVGYTFEKFVVDGVELTRADLHKVTNERGAVINYYLEYWFRGNTTITVYYK
jgi:hypothetical protein